MPRHIQIRNALEVEGCMEKEQLGTRVEPPLGRRLRVYAAVRGQTVAEVVSAALDSYLPPLADL